MRERHWRGGVQRNGCVRLVRDTRGVGGRTAPGGRTDAQCAAVQLCVTVASNTTDYCPEFCFSYSIADCLVRVRTHRIAGAPARTGRARTQAHPGCGWCETFQRCGACVPRNTSPAARLYRVGTTADRSRALDASCVTAVVNPSFESGSLSGWTVGAWASRRGCVRA
jgi:hypothetical protein